MPAIISQINALVLKARLRAHNDTHIVVGKSKVFKYPQHGREASAKKHSYVGRSIRLQTDSEKSSCRCNVAKGNHLVMAVAGRHGLTAQLVLPWKQDKVKYL